MMGYAVYWIFFLLLLACFLALDLGVFHRKAKEMSPKKALYWSAVWIGLALVFTFFVYWIYEQQLIPTTTPLSGRKAALQFITGYLLEKSLSLDNLFVISLIFSSFHIPLCYQHRVLTWGIVTAVILRGCMIIFGLALVQAFSWILLVFGGFLVISGIRMFCMQHMMKVQKQNFMIRIARYFFPVTEHMAKGSFFYKEGAKWMMTPLFLALLQIETADILFAVDSIPAIFAITLDPFLVFTSNIFAILGLRALYFAIAPMIQYFRYLKGSLALILVFIGIKLLLVDVYPIPVLVSLCVVLGLFLGGILLSVVYPKGAEIRSPLPYEQQVSFLYAVTMQKARKIVLFVVGVTLLLIGIAMIFLPGPALLVIPLAIFILSIEFIWAKKFLRKIKKIIEKKETEGPQ